MSDAAYNPVNTNTKKVSIAERRERDRLARQNSANSSSSCSDRHEDRRNSDGSDTEVDDALISDDEKQWETIALERGLGRRPSTVSKVIAAARRHRWMIDTGLLVVILGLVVMLQLEIRQRPSKWQVGGDFMAQGPIFGTKVVKWEADEAFVPAKDADFASNTTLATWNTLMPQGAGWKGSEAQTTFFTTTMTHQLHCIVSGRDSRRRAETPKAARREVEESSGIVLLPQAYLLRILKTNLVATPGQLMMGRIYTALRMNAMPSPDLPADYHSHYLHCIDYLRQATMCAGDVAVEAHEPTDASDNGALDGGWSGHHVCKDYGQVKSYLESQIRDGVRTVLPIDD